MKRIQIKHKFSKWAEYLARYFGHDLLIYTEKGRLMWGSPAEFNRTVEELKKNPYVKPVYQDIDNIIAYLDWSNLTPSEEGLLCAIVPFIEAQLDDNDD